MRAHELISHLQRYERDARVTVNDEEVLSVEGVEAPNLLIEERDEQDEDEAPGFASSAASDLARDADISAQDLFDAGVEPSGETGYTKDDVETFLAEEET